MEDEQKNTEEIHEHSEHHEHHEHHAEAEHHERHDAPEHHEHHEHYEHHSEPEHHHEHHAEMHHNKPGIKKVAVWQLIAAIFAILLVAAIYTHGFSGTSSGGAQLSKDDAAKKVIDYINGNLLQAGTTAKLNSVKEENGLYSINMTISGQTFASYITKDGQLFFPQVFDTSVKIKQTTTPDTTTQTPTAVPKSDKPKVELFVMSHCPYGTQAEKGLLPVIAKLGNKIDFSVKFVYYSMHGQKEVNEEMNQVCIMNQQNAKYYTYLQCFLNNSDGPGCLTSAGIDQAALTTCVAALDKQYNITAMFNDKTTWLSGNYPLFPVYQADNTKYKVGGSPTLIINGVESNAGRSPASYLAGICAAFNTPPAECSSQLATTTYSAGFGYTASDNAATAQCG